jgi:hypothetical protein
MITFTVDTCCVEYLPRAATDTDIIITVAGTAGVPAGTPGPPARSEHAEVILLDCSGSMSTPATKLHAAREATAAALDCLHDGSYFAVVRGSASAQVIYPPGGGMAVATAESRRQAKALVSRLVAEGGTAMGRWLTLARDLLLTRQNAIRHAILLTDGQNEHETAAELAEAVASCEGVFQCDCRAVGRGWQASELSGIASALLGSALDVPATAELAGDFEQMMRQAMGRVRNEVSLRVWLPRGATVRFLKQVAPRHEDLTDRVRRLDGMVGEYPTGAWGVEARDYHLGIGGLNGTPGDGRMRIARVSLVAGGQVVEQDAAYVSWTEDPQLYTMGEEMVSHYTGQSELITAFQAGLAALRRADEDTALRQLGAAVRLANRAGDQSRLDLLAKIVAIDDADAGTVRLRGPLSEEEHETLMLRSVLTRRVER